MAVVNQVQGLLGAQPEVSTAVAQMEVAREVVLAVASVVAQTVATTGAPQAAPMAVEPMEAQMVAELVAAVDRAVGKLVVIGAAALVASTAEAHKEVVTMADQQATV